MQTRSPVARTRPRAHAVTRRAAAPRRRAATATGAVMVILVLAGCATPQSPGDAPADLPAEDATTPGPDVTPSPSSAPGTIGGTSLTITVDATGDGVTRTYTLSCDPVAGDHPDPEAACSLLEGLDLEALAPVPPDAMCTQQYGGPQTATVEGTIEGERVDARFAYTNGCEISRWDSVADLLVVDAGLL